MDKVQLKAGLSKLTLGIARNMTKKGSTAKVKKNVLRKELNGRNVLNVKKEKGCKVCLGRC